MEIGLSIFPTADSIHPVRLARTPRRAGFESLFFIEHTHIPASRKTPYPLGGDLPSIYWQAYDPFVALAQAAAVTTQLRVGTGHLSRARAPSARARQAHRLARRALERPLHLRDRRGLERGGAREPRRRVQGPLGRHARVRSWR